VQIHGGMGLAPDIEVLQRVVEEKTKEEEVFEKVEGGKKKEAEFYKKDYQLLRAIDLMKGIMLIMEHRGSAKI
jgi:hypothetical protein